MYLIRVRLPQRRGSLAAVATRLGEAGVNISRLQVRLRDEHGALVDFLVEQPGDEGLPEVVRGLDALDEVRVQWADRYPSGGGLHHDLEVIERMGAAASAPEQVLVTAAPLLCQAAWALWVDADRRVRFATPLAPELTADDLRALDPLDATHPVELPGVGAGAAVVPLPQGGALVVARPESPDFTPAELARLEYLATHGCTSGQPSTDATATGRAS